MKILLFLFMLAFTLSNVFSQLPSDWEGKVMTVRGLISPDSMGITLPHEHLLIVHKFNYLDLTDEASAIEELDYFTMAGGKTVADASAIGIGRNPEGLKRISIASGTNVIMCAGYYKDQWIADSIKSKSVEQLTEIIISDILNGINGIHAGFIKIAISKPITAFEEKVVRAAARAQLATGTVIEVHFDGDRATLAERNHVLDALEAEGADLHRVVMDHCVPYVYLVNDFISLAKRGCFIAFDMIGLEVRVTFLDVLKLPETLNALIDAGYIDHILLSQDVCFSVCYVKNGGYGYGHILNDIVPQLKANGITNAQIHKIMVDNPKRVFPFKNRGTPCTNELFTAENGVVSDNSGESDYFVNMSCQKLIKVQDASRIKLHFTSFATEHGYDFVKIYDGETTSSPLLGTFSGITLPPDITSTGNSILITFTSDEGLEMAGWNATYSSKILKVQPGSREVSADHGSATFSVHSTTGWSVAENEPWLTAEKTNDTILTVTYSENLGLQPRSADISVTGTGVNPCIIVVDQNGATPFISLSADTINLPADTATSFIRVFSNIEWSADATDEWLTVTKGSSTGLMITIRFNKSIVPRSTVLTLHGNGVSSKTVVIKQKGAIPILSVTPGSREVECDSGTVLFSVASNVNWSVTDSVNWLVSTQADDTTILVRFDRNKTITKRSAEITVSGPGVEPQVLTVNQQAAPPLLEVTPDTMMVSCDSGIISFTIESNFDWFVSGETTWVHAEKTSDTSVAVSFEENSRVINRRAEIVVGADTIAVKTVIVNQDGAEPFLTVFPDSIQVMDDSGSSVFLVVSNIDWSLEVNSGWLTAIKVSDTTFSVSFEKNLDIVSRYAEVAIIGEGVDTVKVTIDQAGGPDAIRQPNILPVNVFPNPVSGRVWFTYERDAVEFIEIYDPAGKLIIKLSDTDKDGISQIDLSGMKAGIYLYRVIGDGERVGRGKIVKE